MQNHVLIKLNLTIKHVTNSQQQHSVNPSYTSLLHQTLAVLFGAQSRMSCNGLWSLKIVKAEPYKITICHFHKLSTNTYLYDHVISFGVSRHTHDLPTFIYLKLITLPLFKQQSSTSRHFTTDHTQQWTSNTNSTLSI